MGPVANPEEALEEFNRRIAHHTQYIETSTESCDFPVDVILCGYRKDTCGED